MTTTNEVPADARDRLGTGAGPAVRNPPGKPEREGYRPASAPAYYLGRPARLWITRFRAAP
jgi:hypothetical protein